MSAPPEIFRLPLMSFTSLVSFASLVSTASLVAASLAGCGGGGENTDASSSEGASSSSSGSASSGSGSSSSSGGPPPLCQKDSVGLQGSIDGEDVAVSYSLLRTRIKGSIWQAFFQSQGHVALFGDSDLEMPGSSAAATGFFRMPQEGPSPGEWFCSGSGSKVALDTQKKFTLASLARLGACPDSPVTGEIDGCLGPDASLCPLGNKLTSSIQGADFDWTSSVTGWGGMPGLYEIYLDNGGLVELYIELDTVLGGLLYIAPGSPDAGALYCFGGGFLQPGGQNGMKFTLTGLSRLGTCADATPVSGDLEGCVE